MSFKWQDYVVDSPWGIPAGRDDVYTVRFRHHPADISVVRSRIHSVVDLRHPDNKACYYCYDRHSLGREYARRFGPSPHLFSKHWTR